ECNGKGTAKGPISGCWCAEGLRPARRATLHVLGKNPPGQIISAACLALSSARAVPGAMSGWCATLYRGVLCHDQTAAVERIYNPLLNLSLLQPIDLVEVKHGPKSMSRLCRVYCT